MEREGCPHLTSQPLTIRDPIMEPTKSFACQSLLPISLLHHDRYHLNARSIWIASLFVEHCPRELISSVPVVWPLLFQHSKFWETHACYFSFLMEAVIWQEIFHFTISHCVLHKVCLSLNSLQSFLWGYFTAMYVKTSHFFMLLLSESTYRYES